MKKLFTSCFAFSRYLPVEATQVQIARWAPDDWRAARKMEVPELAPDNATWRASKAGGNWRLRYESQLACLKDCGALEKILAVIPDGAILLCWEHSDAECHRKTVADFLRRHGLAEVSEYPIPTDARHEAAEAARTAKRWATRRSETKDEQGPRVLL